MLLWPWTCRCAYESMLVALARYHRSGLYAIERSSAAAMDRLAVAARQLPDADREVGPGTGRSVPPYPLKEAACSTALLALWLQEAAVATPSPFKPRIMHVTPQVEVCICSGSGSSEDGHKPPMFMSTDVLRCKTSVWHDDWRWSIRRGHGMVDCVRTADHNMNPWMRTTGFMCAPQDVKQAVSVVEVAAQGAPWAATGAYVDAVREGRGSLALTGAGDPTGRGRGYSYTRDIRRVGLDP